MTTLFKSATIARLVLTLTLLPLQAKADDTLRDMGSSREASVQMVVRDAFYSYHSTRDANLSLRDVRFDALATLEPVVGNCIAKQIKEYARFIQTEAFLAYTNALMVQYRQDDRMRALKLKLALLDNSSRTRDGGWFRESDRTEEMLGRRSRRGGEDYRLLIRAPAIGISEHVDGGGLFTIAAALDDRNSCQVIDRGALEEMARDAVKKIYQRQMR